MEETVHVPKMIPQKRVAQQMVEQIVGVPVPVTQKEIVHVPKIAQKKRLSIVRASI